MISVGRRNLRKKSANSSSAFQPAPTPVATDFFFAKRSGTAIPPKNLVFYICCAQNAKSDQNIKLLTQDGELKTCEYYPFKEQGYLCVLAMQSGDKVLLKYKKGSDSTRYVYTDLATLESCVKK